MAENAELVREISEHYKQHKFSDSLIAHISSALESQDKKDYKVFKSVKDVLLQAKRKNARFVSVFGHGDGKMGAVFSLRHENAQEGEEEFQGRKVWIALKDNITCSFCQALDGQEKSIDEDFVAQGKTKAGMKTYYFEAPPAHFVLKGERAGEPTCRCVATFV